MDQPAIKSIDVLFTRGKDECTRLSIVCETDQLYIVRGVCSRVRHDDFEVQELIEHHAQPSRQDVQNLFDALEAAQLGRWYHHYKAFSDYYSAWYGHNDSCRWSLRIIYQDGTTWRWEGVGDSPASIDTVYEACTQAGMPALHLGYHEGFSELCTMGSASYEDALSRIERYGKLVTNAHQACEQRVDESAQEEFQMLVRELIADLTLFLEEYHVSPLSISLPAGWGNESTADELCAREVDHASKVQVFALFASLVKQNDPEDAVVKVIQSGAFRSWFWRLRAIPREEQRERARQEELQREEKRHELDAIIENRIEQNRAFTAIELARETDTNSSLANARIRRFVKQGRLAVVGESSPKTYRAA